jgi:mycobactin lysine-N-oxygenase
LNTSASEELPPDTFDLESFWSELKAKRFPLKGRIAIVGAGENAASVLLSIAKAAPDLVVDVISPKGFVSTRSENFYENRFYSQPNETSWKSLSPEDRADFIGRTDLGVFSVHAMEILNGERRHRIVPGRLVSLSHDGNVVLRLCYNGRDSHLRYDRVVLATGFDQTATIRRLFTIEALARVEGALSGPLTSDALSSAIESDLSVRGLTPALHLPMLAGLAQGPGFANLSCLGLLSDRAVLEPTLRSQRTFRLTQEAVL